MKSRAMKVVVFAVAGMLTLAACQQPRAADVANDSASASTSTSTSANTPATADVDLKTARAGFQTKILDFSFQGDGTPATPPKGVFNLIRYPARDGDMAAYVTPDPGDGQRHPAVIWLIGGYGGIGSDDFFWSPQPRDNDQSGSAFRKAGIVLMAPSFRAENDNPGQYEMFYGELDDLEAARAWLAQQPYVDPQRIYVVGHSTGGTRALLASELSSDYRAVFSLGGIPDLRARVQGGPMMVNVPFDQNDPEEFRLRSPRFFVTSISTPTFYFEGEDDIWGEFDEMRRMAEQNNIPFHVFPIKGGDHFNIIAPVTESIAQKILADEGATSRIAFDAADIEKIEQAIER